MSYYENSVHLRGNVGEDSVESQLGESGKSAVRFKLATNREWFEKGSDRTPENKKTRTEWHNLVVYFGNLIDQAKRLKKGQYVHVEGELTTRKWVGTDGQNHSKTEIVVTTLLVIQKFRREENGDDDGFSSYNNSYNKNKDFSLNNSKNVFDENINHQHSYDDRFEHVPE